MKKEEEERIKKKSAELTKEAAEACKRACEALSSCIGGMIGQFEKSDDWMEKVKVRELPSGLKIADRHYYELDENGEKKTEFTWDEAMKRFKDDPNWRLPTPKELNQMVLDLGYNEEGVFEGELFAKNLGEDSLEAYSQDNGHGYYWSSTPNTNYTNSYNLYFNALYVSPQNGSNKTVGFTIRCVAR